MKRQVDLPLQALPLTGVLKTLEQAKPRIAFAIIDACRDNPLPESATRGAMRGLAPEDVQRGLLIAYSTEPGKRAADVGPSGDHGPYAGALGEMIGAQGLEARRMFQLVAKKVLDATNREPFPWLHERMTEDFFFHPGTAAPDLAPSPTVGEPEQTSPAPAPLDMGEVEYGRAVLANSVAAYVKWLGDYPSHPRGKNGQILLQRAQEEKLWKRAVGGSSIADQISQLELLLSAYSDGVYAQKALHRLKELTAAVEPLRLVAPPPQDDGSARVTRYDNKDAPGNDRGDWLADASEAQCERVCAADRGCAGYTYNLTSSAHFPKNRIGEMSEAAQSAVTVAFKDRVRSSAGAGAAAPSRISRHQGMDAPGNDRGQWLRDVRNAQECERLCLADKGCVAYTYNERRSVRIPKNRIGQLARSRDPAVTGVLMDRAAAPVVATDSPLTLRHREGMDAPGNDRGSWRTQISLSACENICLSDGGCAGYAYNRKRSVCILKKAIKNLSRAPEPAITGIVEGRN